MSAAAVITRGGTATSTRCAVIGRTSFDSASTLASDTLFAGPWRILISGNTVSGSLLTNRAPTITAPWGTLKCFTRYAPPDGESAPTMRSVAPASPHERRRSIPHSRALRYVVFRITFLLYSSSHGGLQWVPQDGQPLTTTGRQSSAARLVPFELRITYFHVPGVQASSKVTECCSPPCVGAAVRVAYGSPPDSQLLPW